jgi:hypothetical protein
MRKRGEMRNKGVKIYSCTCKYIKIKARENYSEQRGGGKTTRDYQEVFLKDVKMMVGQLCL